MTRGKGATRQLTRIRWAVRGVLLLGVAASVAANVLHARPTPIAQIIAAWPPIALLLTVELISRVPVHRRALAAARLLATAAIASIAAWVSYWHMAGVAARYGEVDASPYLLPFSVDGLVVVASISLVELAGRIRAAEVAPSPAADPVPVVEVGSVPTAVPVPDRPDPGTPAVPDPAPAGTAAVPGQVSGRNGGNGGGVTAELLAQARAVAEAHLAEHGKPITRDQLRVALRTQTRTASFLHKSVRQDGRTGGTEPYPRVNGTPVPTSGRMS